ncbi:MAG: glucan biosynthesis protein [Gammaproteobacteria bacterium]|nr:glucan biosynthesis protein [Gammaproteobacteria bacterium]
MRRREFVTGLLGLLASQGLSIPVIQAATTDNVSTNDGQPFSREWLRDTARRLAQEPYLAPVDAQPPWLAAMDWDDYQDLNKFRADHSLWAGGGWPFQVRLFTLGLYFHYPINLYEVVDGIARPVSFSLDMLDAGPRQAKAKVPDTVNSLGIAGFRVLTRADWERDVFAFLGASYFRAVSGNKQYGLSARGLAIDTGMDHPEEFPIFQSFWLERPTTDATALTIHTLLDSPSITGAYTFVVTPGDTTSMQVETHLFPRRAIERLGIAPMTSMFLCGENDRRAVDDFRPEIHDSDGLALWTGTGEYIWRPLLNPHYVRVNSFLDRNPRGFGLLQRDRDFNNYQDDGAFYHKRPSLWVEPIGDWGQGAVQLIEIPTPDETFDNIVAFWNPAQPAQSGQELNFNYRLYWGERPPVLPTTAEVIATRIGVGGVIGQKMPISQKARMRKFVVDFQGGQMEYLPKNKSVEAVVWASRGQISDISVRPVIEENEWRCRFDLTFSGSEPVDLRCYLRDAEGNALSETWLYQWSPLPTSA